MHPSLKNMSKETIEDQPTNEEILAILMAWLDVILELPENIEVLDKLKK